MNLVSFSQIQVVYQNSTTKTNDYLNLLQKCSHINDALDHVSFDSRIVPQQDEPYEDLEDLNTLVSDDMSNNNVCFQQQMHHLSLNHSNERSPTFSHAVKSRNAAKHPSISDSMNEDELEQRDFTSFVAYQDTEKHFALNQNQHVAKEQIVKQITMNSKLRPTANVFKLDASKFQTNSENNGNGSAAFSEPRMFSPINKYNKKQHSASNYAPQQSLYHNGGWCNKKKQLFYIQHDFDLVFIHVQLILKFKIFLK